MDLTGTCFCFVFFGTMMKHLSIFCVCQQERWLIWYKLVFKRYQLQKFVTHYTVNMRNDLQMYGKSWFQKNTKTRIFGSSYEHYYYVRLNLSLLQSQTKYYNSADRATGVDKRMKTKTTTKTLKSICRLVSLKSYYRRFS